MDQYSLKKQSQPVPRGKGGIPVFYARLPSDLPRNWPQSTPPGQLAVAPSLVYLSAHQIGIAQSQKLVRLSPTPRWVQTVLVLLWWCAELYPVTSATLHNTVGHMVMYWHITKSNGHCFNTIPHKTQEIKNCFFIYRYWRMNNCACFQEISNLRNKAGVSKRGSCF